MSLYKVQQFLSFTTNTVHCRNRRIHVTDNLVNDVFWFRRGASDDSDAQQREPRAGRGLGRPAAGAPLHSGRPTGDTRRQVSGHSGKLQYRGHLLLAVRRE
jgi:hypothetical protein